MSEDIKSESWLTQYMAMLLARFVHESMPFAGSQLSTFARSKHESVVATDAMMHL